MVTQNWSGRDAAGGLDRLFKAPGQKMAHEQSADVRVKGTSTKHVYTHRYSLQNKGAEKQQLKTFFLRRFAVPVPKKFKFWSCQPLLTMAVKPTGTVQSQHEKYATTQLRITNQHDHFHFWIPLTHYLILINHEPINLFTFPNFFSIINQHTGPSKVPYLYLFFAT